MALALHVLALALALLVVGAELSRRGKRWLTITPLLPLLALLLWRGVDVRFVPLTNKYESFLGFAAALLGVAALRHARLGWAGRALLGVVAAGFLGAALGFERALHYPSPLLITTWYALHVPLSFVGYALWIGAAGDGLDGLAGLSTEEQAARRQDRSMNLGLAFFSAAMIFGSVWGVVSWGVYFLWDAKILWSLALWLYFATLVHLRYWPLNGRSARATLGAIGLLATLFTYVGTSFMKGSIHSF